MPNELMFRPAVELAAMVRSGDVSARELVEASYSAIERLNGDLNAFVTLCEERALAEAQQVTEGDDRPLAGVPIAVKDLVQLTEGVRTTFGMAAMEDWVPDHDSAVVRRLRDAGAIIVGKTNTPELGILPVTEPDLFGPSRNPWDTSRTPGGSSGGSGAAVAAGMVPLAHGNDGGGSIRIPRFLLRAGRSQAESRTRVAGAGHQRVRRWHRHGRRPEPHRGRHRSGTRHHLRL
jgi:amidase